MVVLYALFFFVIASFVQSMYLSVWARKNGYSQSQLMQFVEANKGKLALCNLAILVLAFWWAIMFF